MDCDRHDFIAAAKWALSDRGGRLWSQAKNDLFIIDPSYQVKFRHLAGVMASAEGHGWTVDDIRVMPRGRVDSDSREGGMLIP